MVKVYSLNARGLRNKDKRREIFAFIKRKQYDILLIQESHGTQDIEGIIEREWGGPCIFSHNDSKGRGVMIMCKPEAKINSYWNDTNGHLIIAEIEINNVK